MPSGRQYGVKTSGTFISICRSSEVRPAAIAEVSDMFLRLAAFSSVRPYTFMMLTRQMTVIKKSGRDNAASTVKLALDKPQKAALLVETSFFPGGGVMLKIVPWFGREIWL